MHLAVSVVICETQFENGILSPGWYIGSNFIHEIKFQRNYIKTIEPNAFHVNAFKFLNSIYFIQNDGLLHLESDCFRGPIRFESLLIFLSRVEYIGAGLLEDLSKRIEILHMTALEGDIGLVDIFGAGRYPILHKLSFSGATSTQFATLAAENFTALCSVENLSFARCGIEHIVDGAFDGIAHSLQALALNENKMMRIDPMWFRLVLENSVKFLFYLNPLECGCDFYFLTNATAIVRQPLHVYKEEAICSSPMNINQIVCPQMHRYVTRNTYSAAGLISFYVRFHIHFNRNTDSLSIRTNVTASIRVLLVSVDMRQTCWPEKLVRDNVKCYTLPADKSQIRRSMFPNSSIVKISIIYFVQGWPLSTVSVRMLEDGYSKPTMHIGWILTVILSCAVAFLLGFLITVIKMKRKCVGRNQMEHM